MRRVRVRPYMTMRNDQLMGGARDISRARNAGCKRVNQSSMPAWHLGRGGGAGNEMP